MTEIHISTEQMNDSAGTTSEATGYRSAPSGNDAAVSGSSTPAPSKQDDQTTRQKYADGRNLSSSSAIRIVKRKPKPAPVDSSGITRESNGKAQDDEDPTIAALKMAPKKGILRTTDRPPNKVKRNIFFADTKQLPLVHIKEIERIAAIHSNFADFRCSERNEAAYIGQEVGSEDFEDWGLLKVKNARALREELSESGKREDKRISELGLLRGAMFGTYTLSCIPKLNDQAAADFKNYRPIKIPIENVPSEPTTLSALRDFPLPGRKQPEEKHFQSTSTTSFNNLHRQNNVPQRNMERSPLSQNIKQEIPSIRQEPLDKPSIQQVFQETDPVNVYYATTDVKEPEPYKPLSESKFELPSNLKEMLSQLKKKGFVSSEEPAPVAEPSPIDPLTAAMQTAQQLMREQQESTNIYASQESPQDYVGEGYVATFATPEVMAQGNSQDSRNSESWVQSGWKIQEPCVFFVNRPGGCNRGDQCRFIHDEELRAKNLASFQGGSYHQNDHDRFRGGRGRAGFRGGGGFRNNYHQHENSGFHQDNHNDQTNSAGGGHRVSRFSGQDEHNRRGMYNRYGSGPRSRFDQKGSRFDQKGSRFDQKGPYGHQQGPVDQIPPHFNDSQMNDGEASSAKRPRVSRFDQRDNEESGNGDVDLRVRESRFNDTQPWYNRPTADRDDRV